MKSRFVRAHSRFVGITDRLGKRLRAWERQMNAADRDAGDVVSLPSEAFVETYKAYRAGMATLLSEERAREQMRLAMRRGADPDQFTDEQYEQEMEQLAKEALANVSVDVIERLLEERRTRKREAS
jgi:hypothetical protein